MFDKKESKDIRKYLAVLLISFLAGCASTTRYPGEIEEINDPVQEGYSKAVNQWNIATEMLTEAVGKKAGPEGMETVLAAYEEVLKYDPGFAPAYKQMGVICEFYIRDDARAKKYYEQYCKLSPGTAEKEILSFVNETSEGGTGKTDSQPPRGDK
jgi:hypothetical protein